MLRVNLAAYTKVLRMQVALAQQVSGRYPRKPDQGSQLLAHNHFMNLFSHSNYYICIKFYIFHPLIIYLGCEAIGQKFIALNNANKS